MLSLVVPAVLSALLNPAYQTISTAKVVDPRSNAEVSPLAGVDKDQKSLVVLLPQLGEFDSAEMCEALAAADDTLSNANIGLRVIGIGDTTAANKFSEFTGLSLDKIRIDPEAKLHAALGLHAGPGWSAPVELPEGVMRLLLSTLPGGVPADDAQLKPTFDAWLNYLAMCAGFGAPGTLQEIARGYLGDQNAPERFRSDDIVRVPDRADGAPFIEIGPGVGPVRIGPVRYSSWWGDERGYQRPIELATVRLKNMVEVLGNWNAYVSNHLAIAQRGGTFLFDEGGETLYEYKHMGVLTYSETMPRPLSFLAPYIGEGVARNPLGLADASDGGGGGDSAAAVRGRGLLKPAGKAMSLLGPVFRLETELQAAAWGADAEERRAARQAIEEAVAAHPVLVYSYALSPFSSEALAVLDAAGTSSLTLRNIELGAEWFALDKRNSAIRAELLAMTGQSSLPHVFIDGKHVGGLFSGPDGASPGLAALQESGELAELIDALTDQSSAARPQSEPQLTL
jgi:glutaredoxin